MNGRFAITYNGKKSKMKIRIIKKIDAKKIDLPTQKIQKNSIEKTVKNWIVESQKTKIELRKQSLNFWKN